MFQRSDASVFNHSSIHPSPHLVIVPRFACMFIFVVIA